MAVFNPPVPGTEPRAAPEFTNASKSLTRFDVAGIANKSTAIALEGASKIIPEAVDSADSIFKNTIKDEAYNRLRPINDEYTSALETSLNVPRTTAQTDQDQSLLPKGATKENVPQDVQASLSKIEKLDQVRKLKPELQTLYSGQVAAIQKDMRSKYPGYIPYIDQEVTRITGGVNANEHLKNLMTLASESSNRKQAWGDFLDKQAVELARSEGNPSLMGYAFQHRNGHITDEQLGAEISSVNTKKHKNEMDILEANARIKAGEEGTIFAETKSTGIVHDTVTDYMHGVLSAGGKNSIESQLAYIRTASESGKATDPEQLNHIASSIMSKSIELESMVRAKLYAPAPNGGLSWAQMMHDPKKVEALVKSSSEELREYAKLINDDHTGLAFSLARDNKLKGDRATNFMLTKFPFAQSLKGIQGAFGENKQVMDLMQELAMTSEAGKGMMSAVKEYGAAMFLGQTNPSEAIGDAAKLGPPDKKTGKPVGAGPETQRGILNLIDYVSNPKSPPAMAIAMAHAGYDPANQDLIDKIQNDYKEGNVTVKGKYFVWSQYMSDKNIDAVTRLGKEDPSLLKAQKDWGEKTFFKLFKNELSDIKERLNGEVDLSNLKVNYNTKTHHWSSAYGEQEKPANPIQGFFQGLNPPGQSGENFFRSTGKFLQEHAGDRTGLDESLDKVNGAIDRLVKMEKARGADDKEISAYMFNMFKTLGITPKNIQALSPEAAFARSILDAERPEEKVEQADPFKTKDRNKRQDRVR